MISPLSSSVRRRVDHYGFAQFFVGCAFDPAATYVEYGCSDEIYWSSLRMKDCWFLYNVADGRVHRLSAAEVTWHKRSASRKFALLRFLLHA